MREKIQKNIQIKEKKLKLLNVWLGIKFQNGLENKDCQIIFKKVVRA
jgi:hypothetical protein